MSKCITVRTAELFRKVSDGSASALYSVVSGSILPVSASFNLSLAYLVSITIDGVTYTRSAMSASHGYDSRNTASGIVPCFYDSASDTILEVFSSRPHR